MTGYEFIFSGDSVKRLYRHFLFWLIFAVHFIIQNLITGGNVYEALKARSLIDSGVNALFFFPVYILSGYTFINVLLPVYFSRRRYVLFFLLVAVLILFDFAAGLISGVLYLHFILQVPFDKITLNSNRYNAIVNGLFLPTVILGIAGGIKFAKNWYLEQKETQRLAKEKISKDLQLLKNQLHPRFLFYSLHIVKKHITLHPLLAANLILQLSDLLSYILYESDREWVLLDREIEIIKSYLELQKKSSTIKLDTEITVSGVTSGKYISPLLLLSFVENAFDSLLEEKQETPSLQLYIAVNDGRLHYKLHCTGFSEKQPDEADLKEKFMNHEKQLRFIYPDTHKIEMISNPESISIMLNLLLYERPLNQRQTTGIPNEEYELI